MAVSRTPRLVGVLIMAAIASLTLGHSSAGAEIDSNQQTEWGLATQGPSRTVAQWDALGWSVEQIDGTVFVGGKFLDVTDGSTTYPQAHLAAFDAATGAWQAWFRPTVGEPVLALQATADGGLIVGGEIDTWNGQTIGALAKIDPATGALWPGWSTRVYGGGSAVRDLHLGDDGWLYVVGDFTTVSRAGVPQSAAGAVRIDPISGTVDPDWKPTAAGGSVYGVSTSEINDRIYLAGNFLSINALANTGGFVAVDDIGTVVVDRTPVPFNGCSNVNNSYCVLMYDVEATASGIVFVGGVEHSLYALDENNGLGLLYHHYSGCDPSRNAVCLPSNWYGGEFQELEEVAGRVYGTCHCWYDLFTDTRVIPHTRPPATASHTTVDALMAFDAATGVQIQSLRPVLSGDAGGWAMHANPSDGCLWATGGFDSYASADGGQRSANDLLRLCDEAGPGPTAQPVAVAPAPVSCSSSAAGLTATIGWQDGTGVESVIVERSVDGGAWYWRGRIDAPGTGFAETISDNRVTTYRTRYVYPGEQRSSPVPCNDPIDRRAPTLVPIAGCTVTVAAGTATVTWVPSAGAASTIVYRQVNAGSTSWRGRVERPGTTFTDAVSSGVTYRYSVVARSASGQTTTPTTCSPDVNVEPDPLTPIPSCRLTQNGATVTVDWVPSPNAANVIIERSGDGGVWYWRGRVNAPGSTFTDAIRSGAVWTYRAVARDAAGNRAPATICGDAAQL